MQGTFRNMFFIVSTGFLIPLRNTHRSTSEGQFTSASFRKLSGKCNVQLVCELLRRFSALAPHPEQLQGRPRHRPPGPRVTPLQLRYHVVSVRTRRDVRKLSVRYQQQEREFLKNDGVPIKPFITSMIIVISVLWLRYVRLMMPLPLPHHPESPWLPCSTALGGILTTSRQLSSSPLRPTPTMLTRLARPHYYRDCERRITGIRLGPRECVHRTCMETQMTTQASKQMTVNVNTVSGLTMTAILNMPEFTGDPDRLTDFLEAASAAGARLSQVGAECGITGSTGAAEVGRLLSERYGRARRPPARSAVKSLRMRRAHGETPSAFVHRVDQAFPLVKVRMAEVEAAGVATAKLAVIEELLKEAVLSEMPEKLWRPLKALGNANFGVLLAQVDEEEDDYLAAKEDAATWTRVERRSERRPDRGHERRAPSNPPHHILREQPVRNRPTGDQRQGERRERLRCWECGSTRHLARSCPQIFRGDHQETGRRPDPGWGSRVVPCECVATTVSGPAPLCGEIVLSLGGLSGKNRTVVAHVMDWSSNEYEAILVTDALKSVKGLVRTNGRE
ncbi:hypothetical protein AAG570_010848 [Ranatra chinensis]|uniref:CCHC-type domain-containing protein n=1 Tax=Ranatra chinensis TaxID=642074 RepID=A0ABD0YJ51_9HEMI